MRWCRRRRRCRWIGSPPRPPGERSARSAGRGDDGAEAPSSTGRRRKKAGRDFGAADGARWRTGHHSATRGGRRMADIVLSEVSKAYGAVSVLENVSMHIKSGEFIVFLG